MSEIALPLPRPIRFPKWVTWVSGLGAVLSVLRTISVGPPDAAQSNWTCDYEATAATHSQTDVNTEITNAPTEGLACINVPTGDGTETWSGMPNLPNTKRIWLKGPGRDLLIITTSGSLTMHCAADRGHRLSGFEFTGGDTPVDVQGTCNNWRIDNMRFLDTPSEAITVNAAVQAAGPLNGGLIDHNIFQDTSGNFRAVNMNAGLDPGKDYGDRDDWPDRTLLGTDEAIFIEDNLFDFASQTDTGSGVIDSNAQTAWVFRFNTVVNSSIKSHGVCNSEGTKLSTAYYNHITTDSGVLNGNRAYHQQGSGEAIVFGNRISASSGKSTSAIDILHYRSADATAAGCTLYPRCDGDAANDAWDGQTPGEFGYLCRYQPGTRGGPSGTTVASPQYFWDNAWDDTSAIINLAISDAWGVNTPPTVQDHVQLDRDLYEAVSANAQTTSTSPFNGTTGMGFGTLANRPPTCTVGVGYFATDQGSWNTSSSNPRGVQKSGADGVLYYCSSTNSWSVKYTPYTYPHPLQN